MRISRRLTRKYGAKAITCESSTIPAVVLELSAKVIQAHCIAWLSADSRVIAFNQGLRVNRNPGIRHLGFIRERTCKFVILANSFAAVFAFQAADHEMPFREALEVPAK